jgi:D-amino-acid dehydrogenase
LLNCSPGLACNYTHAMYVPHWLMVSDPYDVTVALGRQAFERGASLCQGEVTALEPVEQGVRPSSLQRADTVTAKQAVIAGAWSKTLAGRLGDRIPLEAERGYNTTLPADSFDLRDNWCCQPMAMSSRLWRPAYALAVLPSLRDFTARRTIAARR